MTSGGRFFRWGLYCTNLFGGAEKLNSQAAFPRVPHSYFTERIISMGYQEILLK